ncbi:MAG: signal peptidase I [Spirochaetia bacterium]
MFPRSSRRYLTYRDRGPGGRRPRRYVGFALSIILVYLTIHTLFLQTIRQDSTTMAPTLERGDRLMARPLVYGPRIRMVRWILPGLTEPHRGDLVAIRPGYMEEASAIRRFANPAVRFATLERVRLDDGADWRSAVQVKRLIGLPGDTVRMERFVAFVRPSGKDRFIHEFELAGRPYDTSTEGLPDGWRGEDPFGDAMDEVVLGPDDYFVIGDNRALSIDSRHWGPIGEQAIHGRIIFRYWPLDRLGRP